MDSVGFAWLERLPAGLLDLPSDRLLEKLDGPTVVALSGPDGSLSSPLVIAALMHGNETTGWDALRNWLRKIECRPPEPLIIVLGNLHAAQRSVRSLDDVQDHNRCWSASQANACWELRNRIAKTGPRLAVDIHNTNGSNPCHSIYIGRKDVVPAHKLAAMFADVVIHANFRQGTFMEAFAPLCPSVTIECGRPGEPMGLAKAEQFIEHVVSGEIRHNSHAKFYQMVERIELAQGATIGFGDQPGDLVIPGDADTTWNFTELEPGTEFAKLSGKLDDLLTVIDAGGNGLRKKAGSDFLDQQGDKLLVSKRFTPAMLVCDAKLVRQDCVCYVLTPYELT